MSKYISASAASAVLAALSAAQSVHDKAIARITSLQSQIESEGLTVDTTDGDAELHDAIATFNYSVGQLTDAINAAPATSEPASTDTAADDAPVAVGTLSAAPAYTGTAAS